MVEVREQTGEHKDMTSGCIFSIESSMGGRNARSSSGWIAHLAELLRGFRVIALFLAFPLGLWLVPSAGQAAAPVVMTFGVVPQQSPSKLAQVWGPILRKVGEEVGVKIVFKTAPDITTFAHRLAKGEYDMAYMNPYHYIEFHKKPGYVPLLRAQDAVLRGILVTRRDAPYLDLKALSGKTLAFPAPGAFAASILVRAELSRQHISITPKYVASHDSVYLDVAQGLFPAGGGIMRTFRALNPQIRDQLHVIYKTPGYTPHPIAILARVPPQLAARIQTAFIQMDKNAEGRQLLAPLEIKGWVAAQDADWDDVRALFHGSSLESLAH